MTERNADPGADVGSFLPRSGEAVSAYAERLRGLHRDLTLVLGAVERGLSSPPPEPSERPAPPQPGRFSRAEETRLPDHERVEPVPRPRRATGEGPFIDVRPESEEQPPVPGEQHRDPVPVRAPGSGPRVVVVPSDRSRAYEDREERDERRSEGSAPSPLPSAAVTAAPAPAPTPAPAPAPAPTPAPEQPDAPSWPPPAPAARGALSPLVITMAVTGWLTALALALAYLLGA